MLSEEPGKRAPLLDRFGRESEARPQAIRPCGPLAGVNPLEACKPLLLGIETAGTNIRLSWPATAVGYQVQTTPSLVNPQWSVTNVTVEVINDRNVATLPVGQGTQFFRVAK